MNFPSVFRRANSGENSPVTGNKDKSLQLIIAAGNNDIELMTKLKKQGDNIDHKENITLGTGIIHFDKSGASQPTEKTSALFVALHNGAYNTALQLIQWGANATEERYLFNNSGSDYEKPIDYILNDHIREKSQDTEALLKRVFSIISPKNKLINQQTGINTDLYTQDQRIKLFDALVENVKRKNQEPLELISENTLFNAIYFARSEIIPKLKDIGVEITNHKLINLLHYVNGHKKIVKIMEAFFPNDLNVNITNDINENIGHIAAGNLDLDTFKWAERKGLEKDTLAGHQVPSYAHLLANSEQRTQEDKDKAQAFAKHLVDNGYDTDYNAVDKRGTPTDVACQERNLNTALIFVKNGARLTQTGFNNLVSSHSHDSVSADELRIFVSEYDKIIGNTNETCKINRDNKSASLLPLIIK